jgi:acyl phosphate:glycerol-3-phosphate acyltransferase
VSFYFIAAFLIGSIPNAYLAGRLLQGIDIRQHGSGNVGATNVFRVLGRGPGYLVFVLDFLKGAAPAFFFTHFFPEAQPPALWQLAAGLAAVLGHMFTPFLGFKGGKGVATGAGAVAASFPLLFAVATLVWAASFQLWKTVSLSSLCAVSALFIAAMYTQADPLIKKVFVGILLLVFWSHRTNIRRLREGKETSFRKPTQ